ncbi:MAG: hypothetical protein ACK4UN_16460, partial [Limisphaerales bacterium]
SPATSALSKAKSASAISEMNYGNHSSIDAAFLVANLSLSASMSAHNGGSGPRSNRYSEERFTNWAEYEPWWLEVQAVFKRFDQKIAKNPSFPKIIEFDPIEGFIRPCTAKQVENQLRMIPAEYLEELRAVFILPGTRKQLKSNSFHFDGRYWRCCVFLHAYPVAYRPCLDWLRRFYIRDVLVHEIGHHVDIWNKDQKDRERFADLFAKQHG